MQNTDVFVGSIAMIVGAVVASAAIFNWDHFYQLKKAQWVESLWGRRGARFFFAALGLFLIVLGSAIAIGFVTNRSRFESHHDLRRRHKGVKTLTAGAPMGLALCRSI